MNMGLSCILRYSIERFGGEEIGKDEWVRSYAGIDFLDHILYTVVN